MEQSKIVTIGSVFILSDVFPAVAVVIATAPSKLSNGGRRKSLRTGIEWKGSHWIIRFVQYLGGVFNKTIIQLALVGYEMITTNSALRASLHFSYLLSHIQRARIVSPLNFILQKKIRMLSQHLYLPYHITNSSYLNIPFPSPPESLFQSKCKN